MPHPRLLTDSDDVKSKVVTMRSGVQCVSLPLIHRFFPKHKGMNRITDSEGKSHAVSGTQPIVCWTSLHSPNPNEESECLIYYRKAIRALHFVLDADSDLQQSLPELKRDCELWVSIHGEVDENLLARKLVAEWPQSFSRIHVIHPQESLLSSMYSWSEERAVGHEDESVLILYGDDLDQHARLLGMMSIPVIIHTGSHRFALQMDAEGHLCFHAITTGAECPEALEMSRAERLVLYADHLPEVSLFGDMLQRGMNVRKVCVRREIPGTWRELGTMEEPNRDARDKMGANESAQRVRELRTLARHENAIAFQRIEKKAEQLVRQLSEIGFDQRACCWLVYETVCRSNLDMKVDGESGDTFHELEFYRDGLLKTRETGSALFVRESSRLPDRSLLERIPKEAVNEVYSWSAKMKRSEMKARQA